MKFLIKEISSKRTELRVSLSPVEFNGISYYMFGTNNGNFDNGSMMDKHVPLQGVKFYSVGPNPAIIRLITAFLKDNLGTPAGFANTSLLLNNKSLIPIVNIAVDDINLKTLSNETLPTMVIKLTQPLPENTSTLQTVSIKRTIIDSQEQEVYYISAKQEPDVMISLVPDEAMVDEIGNPTIQNKNLENLNQLTSSLAHQSRDIISDIYSGSNMNFKLDFSKYENHIHFGSAVSKLENFDYKVSQIENHLVEISQSLQTASNAVVNSLRGEKFREIQKIKSDFTPYEKELYYNNDKLNYKLGVPGVGANFIKTKPLNSYTTTTNTEGFGTIYNVSGSSTGSSKIDLFSSQYNVEDKPFYNWSGSFYLSFLMRGDESINGNIKWSNTNENHLPKLPHDTLFTSSLTCGTFVQPEIKSGSWNRYIYQASMSYWAPHSPNPTVGYVGSITDFGPDSSEITMLGSDNNMKTGSYPITVGSRYSNLATNVTSSGIPFTGSILPAGELFHIYIDTPGAIISSSKLTDIRITKVNPSSTLPFSEVFSTSSNEYQTWYTEQLASASDYDRDNPHSLVKTMPAYLSHDNAMNNTQFRNLVNMMGESFDLTKNYIDGFGNLSKTQYGEVGAIPENLLPMIAANKNWDFQLPFGNNEEASLLQFMGSTLASVNTNYNVKNNIFRNIINNIKYIYKTKGTENSIRALLNSYGFPPDILKIREHGASMDKAEDAIIDDNVQNVSGMRGQTGSFSFTKKSDKIVTYNIDSDDRVIKADWARNGVFADGVEFVLKPQKNTNSQTILQSSGGFHNSTSSLWDVVLQPSQSSNLKARLQFRLNTSLTGSLDINHVDNRVSMSTDYFELKNQNFWNVLLQRTEGPALRDLKVGTPSVVTHSYQLYVGEQKDDSIRVFDAVSMSLHGNEYSHSAANWGQTGSRHTLSGSNLIIGTTYTGSIAEFRTWKYALSASKFKQHILDKKSVVGNSITGSQDELIYHYRLNENWESGSSNPTIQDANTSNQQDYSLNISTEALGHTPLYDTNVFDRIQFNVGVGGAYETSDNNIMIDSDLRFVDNLNPERSSTMNIYNPLINKRKASNILELTKSPQEVINNFILNQLGNFDFNDLFADPSDINKPKYDDLEDFSNNFFNYYNISLDVNKFIEAQAVIFNEGLIKSLKRLVPARAVFSKVGVELKPTFFDRQKIQNHSLERSFIDVGPGEIPFTDWEKNKFSLTTVENLLPAILTNDVEIPISSHTGSLAKNFTSLESLYDYKDIHFPIAESSGSITYNFSELEPLYKTNDINIFNVNDGMVNSNADSNVFNITNQHYQNHDIHFPIADSSGSITHDFTKLEPLYQSKDSTINIASATGSVTWDFAKLESWDTTHRVTFEVASSTGSISKDFTKLEPLYTIHDAVFYSHDDIKYEERQAWDRLDKSNDRNQSGYFNFSMRQDDSIKDFVFEIASSTGSISKNFTSLEPFYEYHDLDIFNFNKEFNFDGSSNLISFENEMIQTKDSSIQLANPSGSVLNMTQEIFEMKNSHIELASATGSSQGYYDYTDQYELFKTKDSSIQLATPSGSVLNMTQEYIATKDSSIQLANPSGSVLNMTEEYIPTKDTEIQLATPSGSVLNLSEEYVATKDSTITIASHTGSILNLSEEYIATKNSSIPISSHTGSVLNLSEEYVPTKDVGLPIASHTGSSINLTNHMYDYKDGSLPMASHTGSKVGMEATNEEYRNHNMRFASSTGSITNDFTKLEPLYETINLGMNTSPNQISGSESPSGSNMSFYNEYIPNNNVHFGVASSTGSNPDLHSEVIQSKDVVLNFDGNTTFYEKVHESYESLESKWGRNWTDTKFLHNGYAGKDNDYNTYHYEERFIFPAIGDVEAVSGSYSGSVSFNTDYIGTVSAGVHTASADFKNETFVKLNKMLGMRPMGTTIQFKPSSSIDFGGGKFLDEVMVYPANHIYVVGSSRDCIDRLVYRGTQNLGGDIIESQTFTDLDDNAFYHVLTTGGVSVIVQ